MKSWEVYFDGIIENLKNVKNTQGESIEKAAEILAKCVEKDGLIRVFGAGHSHIAAAEVFWRSATLANIHSIIEPSIAGSPSQVTKSQYVEKMPGYAKILIDYHRIKSPDVVIAVSNGGNNGTTIEFAKECMSRGIKVIVLTNVEYSKYLKPLHHTGKKLMDYCDVLVDNCSIIGDALVEVEDFPVKVGASSTVPFVGLINSILVETVDILVKRGVQPDVYYNGSLGANSQEVTDHNNKIIEKYFYRIRDL